MKHNCATDDRKLAIDRPCSACSGGDSEMEYHSHCPPFVESSVQPETPKEQKIISAKRFAETTGRFWTVAVYQGQEAPHAQSYYQFAEAYAELRLSALEAELATLTEEIAGRKEFLQLKIRQHNAMAENVLTRAKTAEAERDSLREALRWYAELNSYQPRNGSRDEVYSPIDDDCGARARAALGDTAKGETK